ncbi:thioredoxin fold domain-containing protein [Limibacter armeniacum]|uniref:thioredoxin family protein n=1 Tax=Limibacter armeniacum TaxID=466084 RepID=UPI002FE5E5FC
MSKASFKVFITSLIIFISGSSFMPANNYETIEWLTLEEAMKRSEEQHKPVFVDVLTDWCGWCKHMDKNTFQSPRVMEYVANNYLAVRLNPEEKGTVTYKKEKMTKRQFARKFGVNSYPTILLLDAKKAGQAKIGYKEAEDFIEMLEEYKKRRR